MVKKKPHPLSFIHPGTREKAINPSLSGMRPTAHQPRKIRSPPPTKRSKRKLQIKPWGGINRKTLAHQENVGAGSKVVLNAPGPPRGVVVPVVHLVHSDPF